MKVKLILTAFAVAACLASCYDDKGNYDYSEINKMEPGKDGYTAYPSVAIGETLTITPEIVCSLGEEAKKNLSYSWCMEGEIISTEPELVWVADRYPKSDSGNLILTVTDNSTSAVLTFVYSVKVLDLYEGSGIFILSKNRSNGNVEAHFVKEKSKEVESEEGKETIEYGEPYLNIFSTANFGENLPSSTFKIHEHFTNELNASGQKNETLNFSMLAKNELVHVNGVNFLKSASVTLAGMFEDGLPEGISRAGVADAYFGHYLDLITDGEGHVYTRSKTTDEFFDFDKFLSEPLTYLNPDTNEKEVLKGVKLLPTNPVLEYCLLYDTNKNRLFVIWDCSYTEFGSNGAEDKYVVGKLDLLTADMLTTDWPEKDAPEFDEIFSDKYEIIRFDPYKQHYNGEVSVLLPDASGYGSFYFMMLKDKETSKYYQCEFAFIKDYSLPNGTMRGFIFKEMNADVVQLLTNPDNKVCTLKGSYMAYGVNALLTMIASGNELYVYNRRINTGSDESGGVPAEELRKLYSFGSPIASMVVRDATMWEQRMGVILEDGSFVWLSLKDAQYSTWDGIIWKSEGIDFGIPIDMFYECGSNLNWY